MGECAITIENDVTGGDSAFAGKDFLTDEPLESREEYLHFIRTNKDYIEAIADRHPRFVVRMLANFALSEVNK
jgi:hypothetical protein